ncbi:hypothetical protein BDK51DRAFT_42075 [Blyttiomyces helicus]|uniref:Uncharacterized protein n=1 Tax=Blyttiomyces helicus TaxID=388810 RepID=A0A4P9WK97_9FUNG|nr:hypothetical protein BDK51DRAFT_42075 [Blyttiomyces helicus]|eukprot:RKO93234.1 hypothetical protein BDK51DRAFT_42075 [Blyttiomyces helicus]
MVVVAAAMLVGVLVDVDITVVAVLVGAVLDGMLLVTAAGLAVVATLAANLIAAQVAPSLSPSRSLLSQNITRSMSVVCCMGADMVLQMVHQELLPCTEVGNEAATSGPGTAEDTRVVTCGGNGDEGRKGGQGGKVNVEWQRMNKGVHQAFGR